MAHIGHSTIAQLLFADQNTLDFARIVSELDAGLSRMRGGDVRIAWDCDDLVSFDLPDTRILLAWAEVGPHRIGGCLTVSVGPNPATTCPSDKNEYDLLCSRLVDRVLTRFDPAAVLWCQLEGAVDADVVDELSESIPELSGTWPPVESILEGLSRTDLQIATQQGGTRRAPVIGHRAAPTPPGPPKVAAAPAEPAAEPSLVAVNDQPDLPLPRDAELARLRTALYPEGEQTDVVVYSTQMRLAAHCMNATLIVVWAPLGAAVMTYSLLKGENMQLSSRLMAVAGTFFALAHTPVGQSMVAMARGLG